MVGTGENNFNPGGKATASQAASDPAVDNTIELKHDTNDKSIVSIYK